MVLRQLDLDVVGMAGRHRAHDVVGDAARARMRAMEVEIGVVELMRLTDVRGKPVPVRRQIVDQLDAQRVAGLHAQGRPRAAAFIGPDIEPDTADLPVGVAYPQGRAKHAIDGPPHLGLDKRLIHGGRRLVRHHAHGGRHVHGGGHVHSASGSSALTAPAVSKSAPIPMLPSSSWRRDSFFMLVAMATAPFSSGPAAYSNSALHNPFVSNIRL